MQQETGAPTDRRVALWLNVTLMMIVVMTALGGVTRLTGSGLSMVEWRPLMGVLPPIGEAAWQDVFEKYQASPQYQTVNDWMSLEDFKRIFFWEYLHRLFGRLIGLVVALPWLWFLFRRQLSRRLLWQTLGIFVLGGLQGLMGWYMVVSGLVDLPHVSHFRLAAHLLLAFVVAQAVLWVRLDLSPLRRGTPRAGRGLRWLLAGATALFVLQIVYGAFMAGLRAGWLSSTFPDMNGVWLPGPFLDEEGVLHSLLHWPAMVHWTHRALAWLCLAVGAGLGFGIWRRGGELARGGLALLIVVSLQFALGALTVILRVPVVVAVTHQVTALLLLCCMTWLFHRARGNEGAPTD